MFGVIASAASSGIDTALVNDLIELIKSVMTLFKEYPLNILLIGSLAYVAFGLVAKGKNTAKS